MKKKRVTYKELDMYLASKEYFGLDIDKEFLRIQLADPFMEDLSFDGLIREGWKAYLKKMVDRGVQWEEIYNAKGQKQQEALAYYSGLDDLEDDPRVSFEESDDGMELALILHKPDSEENMLTQNDLWKLLIRKGISYGIKDSYIRRLVERPIYEKRFRIATAERPTRGEDGYIIYHFDRVENLAPKIGRDGKADYKNLDFLRYVKHGDLLCEIVPPTRGKEGKALDGSILPGLMGKAAVMTAGKNTLLSPSKQKIYAACDGCVSCDDNQLVVSKFLRVDTVGPATGNIEFIGSVYVDGDVMERYSVVATETIIVEGLVEGSLEAGKNIILRKGIKGGGREMISAGKEIRTEFIENAEAIAKGNIYADVIMNSKIESWENIFVFGKRGRLVGGETWACKRVEADEIGNDANVGTILKLFPSTAEQRKRNDYTQRIKGATQVVRELARIIEQSTYGVDERRIAVVRVSYLMKILERDIEEWQVQLKEMQEWSRNNRTVLALDMLYSNVLIELNGSPMRTNVERSGRTKIFWSKNKLQVQTEGGV